MGLMQEMVQSMAFAKEWRMQTRWQPVNSAGW